PVSLPEAAGFKTSHYRPGLSLDHASQIGVGVSAGTGGRGLGGGSAFYWSDMLGNHNLATLVQMSGSQGGVAKNLGLLADYENRRRRWAWGMQGYQIPYFSRQFVTSYDTPTPGQVQVQDVRSWQIERAFEPSLSYPLSRVQRFELSAGYRNIDFSGEIETLTYSSDGVLIDDTTGPSADEAVPSI